MITSSKLEIVRQCPDAFALPQSETRNAYQDAGNERDAVYCAAINAGDIPDQLLAQWRGATWRTQVRYAFDIDTGVGRELPAGEHRDYSMVREREICGTADVVGRRGELVIVGDVKSNDPNVPRAAVNAQVHIGALALSRAYGLVDAHVFIDHLLRPFDVAELDLFDLDAFAVEAKRIMDVAAEGVLAYSDETRALNLRTGSWCRWCASFDACPKQQALSIEVRSGAAANRVELLIPFRDDDSAADAYEFLGRIKMLSKRLGEALAARAIERPIPLPSGKVYGQVKDTSNERLDGAKTHKVIVELYDRETADAAVEMHATKKRLGEALKARVPKGAAAEATRKVLARVKLAGGVEQKDKVSLEEYDPGDQRAIGPRSAGALRSINEHNNTHGQGHGQ